MVVTCSRDRRLRGPPLSAFAPHEQRIDKRPTCQHRRSHQCHVMPTRMLARTSSMPSSNSALTTCTGTPTACRSIRHVESKGQKHMSALLRITMVEHRWPKCERGSARVRRTLSRRRDHTRRRPVDVRPRSPDARLPPAAPRVNTVRL